MATQVKKLRNYKTFANRGGVRKYMDRNFEDAVWYVYRQDDDGRFYPIVVKTAGNDLGVFAASGVQVDETIKIA